MVVEFRPVNQASRPKANRIPEIVWNQHKAELIRQYRDGGSHGVAQACRWIKSQNFPDFNPTKRQLDLHLNAWGVKLGTAETRTDINADVDNKILANIKAGIFLDLDEPGTLGLSSRDSDSISSAVRHTEDGGILADAHTRAFLDLDESEVQNFLTEDSSTPAASHTEDGNSVETPFTQDSDPVNILEKRKAPSSDTSSLRHLEKRIKRSSITPDSWQGDHKDRPRLGNSARTENPLSSHELEFLDEEDILKFLDLKRVLTTAGYSQEFSQSVEAKDNGILQLMESGLKEARIRMDHKTLVNTLRSLQIPISLDEVTDLVNGKSSEAPFEIKDVRIIEEAAHFFAAARIDDKACVLYFILWVLHADSPAPSERRLSLLKSCAATASSTEALALAQNLLMKEIRRVELLPNTESEQMLLHIVLIVVNRKLIDSSTPREQRIESPRIFSDLDNFLTNFREKMDDPEERFQLDLSSYYILDFAFRHLHDSYERLEALFSLPQSPLAKKTLLGHLELVRSVNLKMLETEFLQQYPGTFGLHNGKLRNTCLRKCLEWYSKTLAWKFRLPYPCRIVRQRSLDRDWADAVAIYWMIWADWQAQKREPQGIRFWDADVERVMGISASQFLFKLISLSLKIRLKDSSRPRNRMGRIVSGKDLGLIQHAREGTDALVLMSDAQLAEEFLAQITGPCQSNGDHLEEGRDEITANFAMIDQSIINIMATKVFIGGMQKYSKAANPLEPPSRRRFYTNGPGSFDPTMASSDTHSSLSAFRKLARRTRRPVLSRASSEASWTQRTATTDELSDSLSLFTISGPIPENAAIDENAAEAFHQSNHFGVPSRLAHDWSSI